MRIPLKPLSDLDLMPWGKFEKVPMGQVPARYLLKLFENTKLDKRLRTYISENFDCLMKEIDPQYFRMDDAFFPNAVKESNCFIKKNENLLNYNA